MTPERNLARLRRYLVALVGLMCLGTLADLLLQEHFEKPFQLVPLGLLVLGALAAWAVWRAPSRRTWRALRVVMALFVVAAGIGMGLHLQGNLAFEQELKPRAPATSLLPKALTGASPILAPGVLVVMAALVFAASVGALPDEA